MGKFEVSTVILAMLLVTCIALLISVWNVSNRLSALEAKSLDSQIVGQRIGLIENELRGLEGKGYGPSPSPDAKVNAAGATRSGVKVDLGGRPPRGNASAQLSIIEFSDFECPFCGAVAPTITALMEYYGGRVNLYYMHLPLHDHSTAAAIAYECAAAQGKRWEMHDLLFGERIAANNAKSAPDFSATKLREFAAKLSLDLSKYDSCTAGPQAKAYVAADYAQGQKIFNPLGTPSFIINCNEYGGAYPYDSFRKILDYELAHNSTC